MQRDGQDAFQAYPPLSAIDDHAIQDRPKMEARARDDEAVPQHVVKVQPLPKVENDAGGIGSPTGKQQPKPTVQKRRRGDRDPQRYAARPAVVHRHVSHPALAQGPRTLA